MSSRVFKAFVCVAVSVVSVACAAAADALPFQQAVEVFRNKEGDVIVFRLRLEQPFLADEFEKSNYLRLKSTDQRAHLIYPKETRFYQKHAEFFGRLVGEGKVTLQLSYEIVSENPDGTRRVEVRQGEVDVPIPAEETGSDRIFRSWAEQQNLYFAHLLRYYPEESFFQYCLLQSRARYGVEPPPLPKTALDKNVLETELYRFNTGSLAIQEALQQATLSAGSRAGDLNQHISGLKPQDLKSLNYEKLLEEKLADDEIRPNVHPTTKLVPQDQYYLHFHSLDSLNELMDLSTLWGENLMRLATVRAQDNQVRAKLEDQLCLRWDSVSDLFADDVIRDLSLTGADPFVLEGADVTVILDVQQLDKFDEAAAGWLESARGNYPGLVSREFNYRGHQVTAHYTNDRVVSSFATRHEGYVVYSNSHRSIRRVIDVVVGLAPSLADSLDYQYVTTILPSAEAENTGFFFASEEFIKRMVGPAAKISQKRRLQCFNNLVMLNNASLFFRLEHGRSPSSLSELIEGKFINANAIVCPHGGSYAFDAEHDMCTCSLHNRLRYLTPNVELSVLKVSAEESAEYDRYKRRYGEFWQKVFGPLAVRITVAEGLKFETCVLPFANSSLYRDLRSTVDKNPLPIGTQRIAPSVLLSTVMVPGREKIVQYLRVIPGLADVLKADPTLTDMQWVGDRAGIHFCDGEMILQIDPTELSATKVPLVGKVPLELQVMISAMVAAANMPVYVTVDVENRDQAARLLEQLSQHVFLEESSVLPGIKTKFDAYRLPDYKDHPVYVFSGQLYALKIRLHAALVGDQLVAATKPEILREVIDASAAEATRPPTEAHALMRINLRALDRLRDDLELYWAEKSRTACHRNISSIYNLCKLYGTPVDDVSRLAMSKYGVTYFCPDGGDYAFDAERDQVTCNVHGNRLESLQNPSPERKSSFARFAESLNEIVATIRFREDALIATVEILRREE
jgi:hypothetical protein